MKRVGDLLAYSDRPGTGTDPAINGRQGYLRAVAFAFRNLTMYVATALLEAGDCRPGLRLRCNEPSSSPATASGAEGCDVMG
jgi:hypothetical protein